MHARLAAIIDRDVDAYRQTLRSFEPYLDAAAKIGVDETSRGEPYWSNDWLPTLDALSLYAFVRQRAPRRYIEIGSGHSTRFCARARQDGALAVHMTSIDPAPRVSVDPLCDTVLRQRLEDVELSVFDDLVGGDMVFFDGSHRAFMNSDATAFFLDVLPALAPGVLVGIHDIWLPEDYPPAWGKYYFSEQYLLACTLLGGAPWLQPRLSTRLVTTRQEFAGDLDSIYDRPGLSILPRDGWAFWFEVTGA